MITTKYRWAVGVLALGLLLATAWMVAAQPVQAHLPVDVGVPPSTQSPASLSQPDQFLQSVDLEIGDGEFNDSGQSLGSEDSKSIELGDLDGDGDLDAFIGNRGANTVWLNDGMGAFTDSGQRLGGSADSQSIALGDLDGDGDIDTFVGNSLTNTVWLNDGAGIFSDSGQVLGIFGTDAVALGDLDSDGDLDAFVANRGDPSLQGDPNTVWLNDGSGTFTDTLQRLGSAQSRSVVLGDVDGDGDLDAFITNSKSTPNAIWFNDGTGSFTANPQPLAMAAGLDAGLGDLDGDGDLDVFIASDDGPNTVWFNDGTGSFTFSNQVLGNDPSTDVDLADLDGDGDLDAFVANGAGQGNRVYLNDGAGLFSDTGQALGIGESQDAAIGDLDGDSDLDSFVANENNQPNKVWLNNGVIEISIAKSASPSGAILAHEEVTYFITATNHSLITATGVSIVDNLPPQAVFLSASPGCTENSGLVLCFLGSVLPQSSRSVTMTIEAWSLTNELVNQASIQSSDFDIPPENQNVTFTQPITISADLALDVSFIDPITITPGVTFTYDIFIINLGPAGAFDTTLIDQLPLGISLEDIIVTEPPGGTLDCTDKDGLITCPLGNLGLESDHTLRAHILRFGFRVIIEDENADPGANRAQVSSRSPDSNPENNGKAFVGYLPIGYR